MQSYKKTKYHVFYGDKEFSDYIGSPESSTFNDIEEAQEAAKCFREEYPHVVHVEVVVYEEEWEMNIEEGKEVHDFIISEATGETYVY